MALTSPGARFRQALKDESPLQIMGTINANHALLAQRAGYRAIYLSGGGVAAGSLGLPDLGINTMDDVLIDVRRITDVCDTPLLVDIDTGFGPSAFNIERTVKSLIKAGAAACHIEDQVGAKRCGHRPGKEIVTTEEMVDRVKAAADAKTDPDFFLIARTDAIQVHGVDAAIERAIQCVEAGADGIFAEAAYDLPTYEKFCKAVNVPVLANITEFGKTLPPRSKSLCCHLSSGDTSHERYPRHHHRIDHPWFQAQEIRRPVRHGSRQHRPVHRGSHRQ
jgi:methylisocitrate lyase